MGLRLKSARLILLIVGTLCLIMAIYAGQFELIKELLSKFLDNELAGYPS